MGNHILRSHCIKEVDFESQLAQVKSKFKAKKEALVKKSKSNYTLFSILIVTLKFHQYLHWWKNVNWYLINAKMLEVIFD